MARRSRVVAITGASSGIGRATALLFARRGWDVGLIARGDEVVVFDNLRNGHRAAVPAGVRLIEADLTRDYQVSRGPVREALRTMAVAPAAANRLGSATIWALTFSAMTVPL